MSCTYIEEKLIKISQIMIFQFTGSSSGSRGWGRGSPAWQLRGQDGTHCGQDPLPSQGQPHTHTHSDWTIHRRQFTSTVLGCGREPEDPGKTTQTW